MARRLIALFFALALGGCDREPNPHAPPASASAAPAPIAPAPRYAVAGEAAFDLALSSEGALLAWAKPGAEGAIEVLSLDRDGTARGAARRIARAAKGASVAELTAASSKTMLAVAWVEKTGATGVTRAALGDPSTLHFAEPALVAAATVGSSGQRGNLALASDGERMMAFSRGEPERCPNDRDRECTRFGFSELAGSSPSPRRIPLSVPAPCSSAIAGFIVLGGKWHYALCSTASGREVTTAFRIQYEPRYAEAHEVLHGCTPAGALAIDDSVIVSADCDGGRRAVSMTGADAKPRSIDLSKASVSCSLGRPLLAPIDLRLGEPRHSLAGVLPAEVAPAGARAVWTGATLLVARFVGGQVSVSRFACRGPDWTRLSG